MNLFIHFGFFDIIDIILVAFLLYGTYYLLKGTTAMRIFLGIVALFLIWQVVDILHMELLSTILGAFVSGGFIALVIIFQPEIRRFLFTVGTQANVSRLSRFFKFLRPKKGTDTLDIKSIVEACSNMSAIKQGALIVITRQNPLVDIVETGVTINAKISSPLIENIFFKNSPLHDGAMVISNNSITAARCILPVSDRTDLPGQYGLRHRAAVGLSENNDPIIIVVSEETGHISVVTDGKIETATPERLADMVNKELNQ